MILPYPVEERLANWLSAAAELRAHLPDALLATVKLPFDQPTVPQPTVEEHVDIVLRSFEGALALVAPERAALAERDLTGRSLFVVQFLRGNSVNLNAKTFCSI